MLPLAWFLYRPIPSADLPTLLYFAIGTQIAALRPIPWKTGHQTVVDPLLVATGLFSPGAGVGLVAWLTTFDGRVPGRNIPWWAFLFRPAESALIHVLPSIAVAAIGHDPHHEVGLLVGHTSKDEHLRRGRRRIELCDYSARDFVGATRILHRHTA